MDRRIKENPLAERIQIRMTPARRDEIEAAALRAGVPTGQWVREAAEDRLRREGR
jgi:hypothetical protein